MGTPTISLLSGLVKGYTDANDEQRAHELSARKETRDSMLQYLGHMVNSPDIPAEHKQWALQQIPLLAQHDITKKLPKGVGDLSTLPPVTVKQPGQVQSQTIPAVTPQTALQAPVGPGAGSGASTPAATPQGASSDVGRASNGTVNALGAATGGLTPPIGPQPTAVRPPSQIPTPAQTQLSQAPDTTTELAPGGAPHILTIQDKLAMSRAAEQEQTNALQQQYPDKSPEDIAYFAKHGEFPKDEFTLTPGEKRYKDGKVIAENKEAKPGAKSGFAVEKGPSGEPLIKDNATGATLTSDEVAANPEAKKLYDSEIAAETKREAEAQAKEDRRFHQQLVIQTTAFENALKKADYATAKRETAAADRDYDAAVDRMKVMDSNVEAAKNGDQQAMISLLTNHIGMTLGAQKGARMNQAIIEEAEKSAPITGRIAARFDDQGYLTGVVLTPQQIDSMTKLAHDKADILREHANTMRDRYQDDLHQGPKAKSKEPIQKPVGGGESNAHPDTHQWSASTWKAANPKGDVEAAKKAAKAAGYEVVD